MRHLVVLVVALAGCKYLDQPKKVAALEKRLDEVSAALSELTGEPVGLGAKELAKLEEERAKEKKAAGKGKRSKTDKAAKPAKAAEAAKHAKHAKVDEDTKADEEPEDAEPAMAGEDAAASEHEPRDPPAAGEPVKAPVDVHWAYQGAEGPAGWAKLDPSFKTCATGEHQSPIDILPRRSQAPELIFVYRPSAGTVIDNGHTLEVALEPGSFVVIDGTRFDLVQLHLHTPSEHTVAGDSFPMELHLVHRSKAGKLAVIGVLFTEGEASPAMAPLWKAAPKAKGASPLKQPFDPSTLLPKDQAAYRYDGSLTTPPCSEGVIWHVLRRPRTEDDRTIQAFRRRFGANARPVQELGARELR